MSESHIHKAAAELATTLLLALAGKKSREDPFLSESRPGSEFLKSVTPKIEERIRESFQHTVRQNIELIVNDLVKFRRKELGAFGVPDALWKAKAEMCFEDYIREVITRHIEEAK